MKPLPRITSINRPFFEACDRGDLLLQRCQAPGCGRFVYFPRVCCPYCQAGELEWQEASGRGRIISFTVIRRPQHRSFFDEAPYYFVAVELDEGPLVYSRMVETPHVPDEEALMGRRVRVVFTDHAEGHRLPFFTLANA